MISRQGQLMLGQPPHERPRTSGNRAEDASTSRYLAQLIDQAMIFLETDRERAQRCLKDASVFLCAELRETPTVAPSLQSAVRLAGLTRWQVKCALHYIDANLGSAVSVGELARSVGLSNSHFSRAFKGSLGVSPRRYVVRMRVERAKLIMGSTNQSLCDISADCGFADQAHLTRCFRRVVGMTPSVWRRLHGCAPIRGGNRVSARLNEVSSLPHIRGNDLRIRSVANDSR
jgi:transcriptional regulator GlxA family with amidase domain